MYNRLKTLTLTALLSGLAAAPLLGSTAMAQVAQERPDSFVELVKQVSPAVINISTAQTIAVDDKKAFEEGSPLERFNDFFGGGNGGGSIANALGSGFVIDPTGYVVTNNHVIEDADEIEVTFPDGQNFSAELIGRDPETDLALLKIENSEPFPYVEFAPSASVEVGEWVIAIGNPFGYGGSVAQGIVSAQNRNISHGRYDDFIQTDVAINKGNSGGPLFDLDGKVVGVNTAILSTTGFSAGISFSIPSDLTQSVIKQLREYGETRRGYLGAAVKEVTDDLAESYGLEDTYGAIITEVKSKGPADKAKLIRGDLITHIDGVRVDDNRAMNRMIAEASLEEPVEFDFVRKRKPRKAMVTIERREEKVKRVDKLKDDNKNAAEGVTVAGVTVVPLDEAERRKRRLPMGASGVLVSIVDKNSDAAGKVQVGDIIEEVELESVSTPAEFKAKMAAAEEGGKPVTILISRNGNPVFYALRQNS